MGNKIAVRVIANGGLDIFDSPNGSYQGHYNKGDIIRTLEPDSRRPANDGKVYACYTVGGHPFMKNWVAVEDEKGYATVEQIDY